MSDSSAAGGDASPTRGFSASLLRSLRHRNYRLFVVGQGLSLFGTWMTTVATRWLVYEKMPGQDWILGIVTFAGQIPILLAPIAGTWVEGSSRHRTLVLTQALSMIQSFSLAFLALSGLVEVWQVLVLAAFQGTVNALDVPARQAFLVEMVDDRNDLGNAIALNSSMFNGARLLGPAIAGLILASFTGRVGWGAGICFSIDGISYFAVIIALLRMNVKPAARTSERQIWTELKQGFRYSFHSRPIRAILLLLALVSIFGTPFMVLMPAFAKNILHGNAGTYGLLLAVSGAGALLGGLYLASRSTVLGLGRVIAYCCALFAISIVVFAFSKVLWLTMLATFVASFGMMVQMAASNTILQTIVEDEMRARVMSFYAVNVLGMIPIGSLLCAGLVVIIGAPYTVALGGVVSLGGAIYFSLILPGVALAAARPMLERAGVLPPLAAGLQAATNQTGEVA